MKTQALEIIDQIISWGNGLEQLVYPMASANSRIIIWIRHGKGGNEWEGVKKKSAGYARATFIDYWKLGKLTAATHGEAEDGCANDTQEDGAGFRNNGDNLSAKVRHRTTMSRIKIFQRPG